MRLNLMFQPQSSRELNYAINDMVKGTRQTLDKVLPKEVRLLMTDFAQVTRPKGREKLSSKDASSLKRRIRQVYPDPGWVVNMMKKVDEDAGVKFALMLEGKSRWKGSAGAKQAMLNHYLPGLKITFGTFDKGALHKAQRHKKRPTERRLVMNRKAVEAYIKRKIRMLGFAKAGFANACKSIGGARGIPGWVKRHKEAPGSVTITGTGSSLTLTVVNRVRHLRQAFKSSDEAAALRTRASIIAKDLQNKHDAKIRKRMERANRST